MVDWETRLLYLAITVPFMVGWFGVSVWLDRLRERRRRR